MRKRKISIITSCKPTLSTTAYEGGGAEDLRNILFFYGQLKMFTFIILVIVVIEDWPLSGSNQISSTDVAEINKNLKIQTNYV